MSAESGESPSATWEWESCSTPFKATEQDLHCCTEGVKNCNNTIQHSLGDVFPNVIKPLPFLLSNIFKLALDRNTSNTVRNEQLFAAQTADLMTCTHICVCPSVECRFSSGSNSSATGEKDKLVSYEERCLQVIKPELKFVLQALKQPAHLLLPWQPVWMSVQHEKCVQHGSNHL